MEKYETSKEKNKKTEESPQMVNSIYKYN